jgi:hypothetical protein
MYTNEWTFKHRQTNKRTDTQIKRTLKLNAEKGNKNKTNTQTNGHWNTDKWTKGQTQTKKTMELAKERGKQETKLLWATHILSRYQCDL